MGGVILFLLFPVIMVIVLIKNYYAENPVYKLLSKKRLSLNNEQILENKFKYYRELTTENKIKFSRRVNGFIQTKKFEGKQGLVITKEMKLLTAAIAIKLTFGFNESYLYDALKKILIYPEAYYSRLTRSYNKGETSSTGFIAFSWIAFMQGLKNDHDNINLGFHEFMHALLNEGIIQMSDAYEILCKEIEQGDILKESRKSHLLRDYAYTNKMEFISCVVETFFESPEIIYRDVPLLYHIFSNLLNQDPLNKRVLLFTDDDLKDITI